MRHPRSPSRSSTSPLTPAALRAYFFFSAVTLNLKKMMSPSLTTYSLPSVLYLPAFSRLGVRVSLRVGVKGTGYGQGLRVGITGYGLRVRAGAAAPS